MKIMFTQFVLALKDMRKNVGSVILFAFQMLVALILLSLLIGEWPWFLSTGKGFFKAITTKQNIVYMNAYMNNWEYIYADRDIYNFFKKIFDERGDAYAIISINDVDFEVDYHLRDEDPDIRCTTFIVGNYDLQSIKIQEGNIYTGRSNIFIGSKVKSLQVGDSVFLGYEKNGPYEVNGRLKKGEGYLDQRWFRPLDECMLVLMTYEEWVRLNKLYAVDAALQSIHLIDPDPELIDQVVDTAAKTKKYTLLPEKRTVKKVLEGLFERSLRNILSISIYTISIIIFVFSAFFAMLLLIIDRNYAEYVIHHIYGATRRQMFMRIFFFVSMILLMPFLVFLLTFSSIAVMAVGSTSIHWIYLTFLLLTAVLSSYLAILRLRKKDMMSLVRRD